MKKSKNTVSKIIVALISIVLIVIILLFIPSIKYSQLKHKVKENEEKIERLTEGVESINNFNLELVGVIDSLLKTKKTIVYREKSSTVTTITPPAPVEVEKEKKESWIEPLIREKIKRALEGS